MPESRGKRNQHLSDHRVAPDYYTTKAPEYYTTTYAAANRCGVVSLMAVTKAQRYRLTTQQHGQLLHRGT
ncbi:hypothetical protein DAPPUDRAFT_241288 [Daphnia pulex]|uniref:Uncharacterized protein n=1 Tax=Daphnia pulex TaxID=6669 RepID=E9GDW4_DAPPU|nr:hypothetical protein DAPPUDRAFT_241288 [Daphnia pulex]|eukprot:EFX82156.1 hypothetical protein DAPPUDRAFT_241288 [Daphnia pulex]